MDTPSSSAPHGSIPCAPSEKKHASMVEILVVLLQAFFIAFVIRLFLFQSFVIPSGSMIPTLQVGDYIFVNKFSYGYGKHSFDFSAGLGDWSLFSFGPLPFQGRVLGKGPERGDVVVFKLPTNPKIDYIKRVIGLPGDKIQVLGGVVYINGTAVKQEPMESYYGDVGQKYGGPITARRYKETLPNGVSYTVLDLTATGELDNTPEFVIPKGHYFMMGDNRDNSEDSRTTHVGFVPLENLVGKAVLIFFSIDPNRWLSVRFQRLFSWIQ